MLKNKLQIFLITYNRQKKLKNTLDSLLNSPVAGFDITVLDNASTDGTSEMLDEYAKEHKNITHIRHKTNIGGNANICRAFEMAASCGKEYAWILCDDDKYDWSNWEAVEKAIEQNPDLICVADYIYPDEKAKTDPAYQIFQMTFVPATIFKTSLVTNGVLMNMYDAIYTMFQQTCLTAHVINDNGSIIVLDKPVVFNGLHFEETYDAQDLSYTRGTDDHKEILARRRDTIWILGFCNVISLLKDENLKRRCMSVSIPYKDIFGSQKNFIKSIKVCYGHAGALHYFQEIYDVLPDEMQRKFKTENRTLFFRNFIKWLLSVDQSSDGQYRILRLFGFEIKLCRKNNDLFVSGGALKNYSIIAFPLRYRFN